jgi:hypothetical protein
MESGGISPWSCTRHQACAVTILWRKSCFKRRPALRAALFLGGGFPIPGSYLFSKADWWRPWPGLPLAYVMLWLTTGRGEQCNCPM